MRKMLLVNIFLFLLSLSLIVAFVIISTIQKQKAIQPDRIISNLQILEQDDQLTRGNRDKNTEKCIDFYKRTNNQLSLYNLPIFIAENVTATDLLQKNCLMAYQIGYFDVTGDNKKDILLITEAIDCVTCRNTRLIIFDGSKVLLDKQVKNALIRPISGRNNAFELKEPIYGIDQEGICCPSKGIVKAYEFRGTDYTGLDDTQSFVLKDEYSEKYKSVTDSVFSERQNYY